MGRPLHAWFALPALLGLCLPATTGEAMVETVETQTFDSASGCFRVIKHNHDETLTLQERQDSEYVDIWVSNTPAPGYAPVVYVAEPGPSIVLYYGVHDAEPRCLVFLNSAGEITADYTTADLLSRSEMDHDYGPDVDWNCPEPAVPRCLLRAEDGQFVLATRALTFLAFDTETGKRHDLAREEVGDVREHLVELARADLDAPTSWEREQGCQWVGILGDTASRPTLEKLLRDPGNIPHDNASCIDMGPEGTKLAAAAALIQLFGGEALHARAARRLTLIYILAIALTIAAALVVWLKRRSLGRIIAGKRR